VGLLADAARSARIIEAWGFTYKTCGFDWMKADDRQPDMFRDSVPVQVGMGYWTRANSEPCLLATRGKPKRLNADVRMGIIEPRRQHSRKPDCVPSRIERLVEGPYLELFARTQRPGWTVWGNQTDKFEVAA
jgi:N6-adenosine-specific RNA methylase IME4